MPRHRADAAGARPAARHRVRFLRAVRSSREDADRAPTRWSRRALKRVVVGCLDPYPPVRGRGVARLRKAGIDVALGVLEDECKRLNEGFITRVTRRRPFVLLKLAMSLDGRIATGDGDSRWISSAESREMVHRWRAEYDAVMVGAGTVIADNPRLTCRIEGGRDPVRDNRRRGAAMPRRCGCFSPAVSAMTILVTAADKLRRARRRYASAQGRDSWDGGGRERGLSGRVDAGAGAPGIFEGDDRGRGASRRRRAGGARGRPGRFLSGAEDSRRRT